MPHPRHPVGTLRRYLIAGLLVWVPLGVTLLILNGMVNLMDRTLLVLPDGYHPDQLLGFHIPGLGVVLSAAVVLFTGMVAANLFGRKLVSMWEALMARIPLVRTLYSSIKQVTETVFSSQGKSFRKVLLIEYPRQGLWTLAFYTGSVVAEVQEKTAREVINIFVPTTPNPTSGFFMMVPREDVIELDMSVDEGLKMIVTMGVIAPLPKQEAVARAEAVAKASDNP